MTDQFLANTSQISYSLDFSDKRVFSDLQEIDLSSEKGEIKWLNTYGMNFRDALKEVAKQNKLDDFLIKLLADATHPNKVIELDDMLFVSLRVLKTERVNFEDEQMMFMVSSNFVWSIQEKPGDHFGWIRERIHSGTGIVRKKHADYLLFLIIESIVDNYHETYHKYTGDTIDQMKASIVKPTPEFTQYVEELKSELFRFKKASMSLRDTIVKLENVNIKGMRTNYFSELKEQINNLITDIEFDFQELESKLNLIFSIQGHRLNEVMKTLTMFSVIFIPLTFIVGVYGMNFDVMPELRMKSGYFILLGAMFVVSMISIWFFRRKKWF
jgi:magnesium transporter